MTTTTDTTDALAGAKRSAGPTGPPVPSATARRAEGHAQPAGGAPPAHAILQFLPGWVVRASGDVSPGGRLLVEYDPTRLLPSTPAGETGPWELSAQVRFHPQGEDLGRSLFRFWEQDGRPAVERADAWAHEVEVPPGARHVELWFRVSRPDGTTLWDSAFGRNYWFEVAGSPADPPAIPAEVVRHRPGAEPRPDLVTVLEERIPKGRRGDTPQALQILTRLEVEARCRTRPSQQAAVWADVHIFDGDAERVHAATYAFDRVGADADGERFSLDASVYEASSLVPPGSVARPSGREARKLQYRLYLETGGRLFTDGLLHQHDLPPDAISW